MTKLKREMRTEASSMQKILVVYGTRPEAIKMAPLIYELRKSSCLSPLIAVTGQHREMLEQVNHTFGLVPDFNLDVFEPGQTLDAITAKVTLRVCELIRAAKPAVVAVQGDTTSCFAAALAAYYCEIPVVHLEAGLRSGNSFNPFPEEMNRRLTAQVASLHLAPTVAARVNLEREGISPSAIVVTGNTVVDALHIVSDLPGMSLMRTPSTRQRTVLVTSHRRESWGEPMARTATAIASLAEQFHDVEFLLPAHLNPIVRRTLLPPLEGLDNVKILPPLGYLDFVATLKECYLVLTDSGGVQEEAPTFGKPVLVLRDNTERPEAVTAGTAKLVGTNVSAIVEEVTKLLTDHVAYREMSESKNPFGDGKAGYRSVRAIENFLNLGTRPVEFSP